MSKPYVLELATGSSPLHVRIAQSVANDIARGRLKAGARLPGSRSLAQMLGVHRNTVNAALAELTAQGWVEPQPARGYFVREPDPSFVARDSRVREGTPASVPERPGFELGAAVPREAVRGELPKALILTGGVPDPRLFPHAQLARAYRRALKHRGPALLDYGYPQGEPSLREALANMVRENRGIAARADDVLVTRGSQQAIWLAAQALCSPGDRVGVEELGYPPAWGALRMAGAQLVPLELDHEGVRVESVERALASGPLRALYLTPHHQYPTMVALSPQRRLALLDLARRHRFAILEDDYSHEFHYEGRPRLPMASSDSHGNVVYLGGLSKILAPGLRVGYVVAPRALLARMADLRSLVDRQGDALGEAAVAELIAEGDVARHARKMREIYLARRSVLVDVLRREFGDRMSFEIPQGGMALWIEVRGVKPSAWAERAKARGVWFRAGVEFSLEHKTLPYVRMGFTRLDEKEIHKAVKEAAKAWSE
ncbi:MAG: PLP-dependent aminotransferase family protein [Myxococcales bacterium]